MKTAQEILNEIVGFPPTITKDSYNILHYYQALKAMEEYAKQFKYDFSKHCRCKHAPGSTWCCNLCGLPIDNKSVNYKKQII